MSNTVRAIAMKIMINMANETYLPSMIDMKRLIKIATTVKEINYYEK